MEKYCLLSKYMEKNMQREVEKNPDPILDLYQYVQLRNIALDVCYSVFKNHDNSVGAVRKLTLLNDLKMALEKHQLIIHYQPLINLSNGKIIGAEALLRWNHPKFGFISPDEFIPLAEKSGLIIPIGEWVLREACLQGKKWSKLSGIPFKIGVNFSPHQFTQPNLASKIQSILEEIDFPPQRLTLELTESVLIEDMYNAQAIITQLKNLGISLAIDDFGTGYSSLTYLQKFPFDILKIDKSFIIDATNNKPNMAIITGIISIAHALNLTVVAEGLETEAELDFLTEKACNIGQGYFFSRPVCHQEFLPFLNKNFLKSA